MFMAVGLFLLGCPDIDTDPPPAVALCKPNSLSPCPCTDGKEGTQKCSVDGQRYGVCSCDAPKPPPVVNGCYDSILQDHTADDVTTVVEKGGHFSPDCILIKAGSRVKFVADFNACALIGGEVTPKGNTYDHDSPIKQTDSGESVTFAFPSAGQFGFYCKGTTYSNGDDGAVFVE
jgi:plastocyanin